MAIELLRRVGLSDGEIKVYSVLLNAGQGSVNKIHEKTGIERRNIYDILNKLIERGLVTYITENKKRVFQASNPKKIIDYINEKKSDLDKTAEEISIDLPRLEKQFNLRMPEVYAEVYRGIDGTKAVWEDMLNYDKIYWIAAARYIPKMLPTWFSNWNARRMKLGISIQNLLIHEMRKEVKKPWQLENVRFLPEEFSGSPTVVSIFGNKVVSTIYSQQPFSFLIQNAELAANYRRYFKYLWEHVAKP